MKRCEWIVYERTGRWAAGLRTTAARHDTGWKSMPLVLEARSLSEFSARLDERPASLAFIEVHAGNMAEVLSWLAAARGCYRRTGFLALLNSQGDNCGETGSPGDMARHQDVVAALLEAGAVDVAHSPRYLQNVLAIGRRQLTLADDFTPSAGDRPVVEWARSLLPWQGR